ncbi:hypothetical protein MBLNU459_g4201t1 [Dothideomycetes sp. NU459]
MASYLITGASRGLGFELTKQLLELPTSRVGKIFAVTRSTPPAPLQDLIRNSADRIVHVTASVDDTGSVQNAAEVVKAKLDGQGLDVLINNAGIASYTPGGARSISPEQLAQVFDVNVIGPQRVIASFLPLLEIGKEKKVINITSTLGSISWAEKCKAVPTHAYKISKAALNMLNAQYAADHADAGFIFLCVSPGWLKTDLGGEHADFDVEVGASELKRIILESSKAQNGKFLNIRVPGHEDSYGRYDGGEIPW